LAPARGWLPPARPVWSPDVLEASRRYSSPNKFATPTVVVGTLQPRYLSPMSTFRDEFPLSPTTPDIQNTPPLADPGSLYPMILPTAPGQPSLPPPAAIPLIFSGPGPSNPPPAPLSTSSEGSPQIERKSTQKSRRKRQRIELSPDQPLTVKGTQRTRVYTACLPW